MVTKIRLFMNMKNEVVARSLGLRRLRQPPANGQSMTVSIDGRDVRARISSFAAAHGHGSSVLDVYADEL